MPPLAGFGLASGNFSYFIGASYLFVINCIFIMLATYVSVKHFGFREATFTNELAQRRTRIFSTVLIVHFIVPSIWTAVTFVRQNNFEGNATTFAEKCKVYGRTILYDYKIDHTDGSVINLFFSGEPLSDQTRRDLLTQAAEYNIKAEQVVINEYTTTQNDNDIELVKSIYDRMNVEVARRDDEISKLRQQLDATQQVSLPYEHLTREIIGIYPSVRSVVIARGAVVERDSLAVSPCISVIVRPDSLLTPSETLQLTEWLRVRLNEEHIVLSQQLDDEQLFL